ncbi:MAG: hypothetical protein ACE5F8_06280 [Woeseiaceae bacterium]
MKKLKLSEWASLAEIIGAVAVVVSLIYVGLQVRNNTEAILSANRQELVGRAHSASITAATSPEISGVFAKSDTDEELGPTERIQHGYFVRAVLYDVQEAYLLHNEDRLDAGYWATRAALFDVYMRPDLARQEYERVKSLGLLHKDFVSWADMRLVDMSD